MNKKLPTIIFLMGPTASGKTSLAIKLKKYIPVEIISVDSGSIYRGMDIGTAKPNYIELLHAPHSLINIRNPSDLYSLANFYYDALQEINKIISLGKIPLLVGGTMLYYKTLLNGLAKLPKSDFKLRSNFLKEIKIKGQHFLHNRLKKIDPISANKIHPNDLQRTFRALEVYFLSGQTFSKLLKTTRSKLSYNILQFAIIPSNKEWLNNNIYTRLQKMLQIGFEKEVKQLIITSKLKLNMPAMQCVGYMPMWLYIHKKIDYSQMIANIIFSTRKLAKHQMTWLRKWENLNILNSNENHHFLKKILNILKYYNI